MRSDEFIREVDEELKRDRMMALWKRYGTLIVAVAVAIVLGTAGGVAWRAWQESQRVDEARRFDEADRMLAATRAAEAAEAFGALADEAGSGYAVLARLRQAQALARAGDEVAARAALERLAEARSVDAVYRDLGAILASLRALDELDPAEARARVEAYARPGHPWRYSARELQALAALQAGEVEDARRTLEELVGDAGTPPQLRRRAAELLAALGGPLDDDVAEP